MSHKNLSAALTTLAIGIVVAAIILENGGTRPVAASTSRDVFHSCEVSDPHDPAIIDDVPVPAYMDADNYPD